MGLVSFKNGNYTEAKEFFKKAVILNQDDNDARYNYEVAKIMEEKQKKEQEKQQQKEQEKEEKKEIKNEETEKMLEALQDKEKKENQERTKQKEQQNGGARYW